jgi:hypothetical protein
MPQFPTRQGATRRTMFAGAALLLLAACSGPDLARVEPVNFAGRPAIRLNVARVDTVDQSGAPAATQLAQSPAAAIRNWGAARLHANGQAGTARLIIQQATLTSQPLATQGGLTSLFNDQPAQQLTLQLVARLEIGAVGGYTGGYTDVHVNRSTTVPESANATDMARAQSGLLQDGMSDFDRQFEGNIRQYLAPLVLP